MATFIKDPHGGFSRINPPGGLRWPSGGVTVLEGQVTPKSGDTILWDHEAHYAATHALALLGLKRGRLVGGVTYKIEIL